jgi:hypothetical protein
VWLSWAGRLRPGRRSGLEDPAEGSNGLRTDQDRDVSGRDFDQRIRGSTAFRPGKDPYGGGPNLRRRIGQGLDQDLFHAGLGTGSSNGPGPSGRIG